MGTEKGYANLEFVRERGCGGDLRPGVKGRREISPWMVVLRKGRRTRVYGPEERQLNLGFIRGV